MNSAIDPRLYTVPLSLYRDDDAALLAPDGARAGPWTAEGAARYCERIATAHYENFPLASRCLPARVRPHVMAIYAFARTADDFADEPRFEGRRVEALNAWEELLEASYRGEVQHPIFLALRSAVRAHNIPINLFKALLTAFRMDLTKNRYSTFRELRHYCALSANPIGRLVLCVHDYQDPDLARLSDELCTALQLANFLQRVGADARRGRCYLPTEDLIHFGVEQEDLLAGRHTQGFLELMMFSVSRARSLFLRGRPLIRKVTPGLSLELEAIWRSGVRILDRIEKTDDRVLARRPRLDRGDVARIAARSILSFGRRLVRHEG